MRNRSKTLEELLPLFSWRNLRHLDTLEISITFEIYQVSIYFSFFNSFKEQLGMGSLQKLTKVKRKARTQFSLLFFFGIRISNFSVLDSPSVSTLVTVNESSIIFTWYIGYCGQKFANSSLSSDRSTISLSTVHLLSIILVLSLCNSCKTATRCQNFSAIPMQKRNHASPVLFTNECTSQVAGRTIPNSCKTATRCFRISQQSFRKRGAMRISQCSQISTLYSLVSQPPGQNYWNPCPHISPLEIFYWFLYNRLGYLVKFPKCFQLLIMIQDVWHLSGSTRMTIVANS